MANSFLKPPHCHNKEGKERRVGIEIEFATDDVRAIAETVASLYSGRVEKENDHRYHVVETELGTFTVELDTQYAHPDKASTKEGETPLDLWLNHEIRQYVHSLIGNISKTLVPYEIVTPPIAISRLDRLNHLIQALRQMGAEGTDENPFYAFGVHLNPEVPSFQPHSILNHLRALILMSDWLHVQMNIDWTRRLSPYIKPFPEEYARLILHPGYEPDLAELIDDYLKYNPTRNRELDLVPLWLYLDRERVEAVLQDNLSSARPTFHYRLPDCRLNDPEWSLAGEWNTWVQLEQLADDESRLNLIRRAYLDHQDTWFAGDWAEQFSKWAKPPSLAR